jgi:hypothetical protein
MRYMYKILCGKPEEKRSSYQWEDNIKMDIKKMVGRVWIGLIWLWNR